MAMVSKLATSLACMAALYLHGCGGPGIKKKTIDLSNESSDDFNEPMTQSIMKQTIDIGGTQEPGETEPHVPLQVQLPKIPYARRSIDLDPKEGECPEDLKDYVGLGQATREKYFTDWYHLCTYVRRNERFLQKAKESEIESRHFVSAGVLFRMQVTNGLLSTDTVNKAFEDSLRPRTDFFKELQAREGDKTLADKYMEDLKELIPDMSKGVVLYFDVSKEGIRLFKKDGSVTKYVGNEQFARAFARMYLSDEEGEPPVVAGLPEIARSKLKAKVDKEIVKAKADTMAEMKEAEAERATANANAHADELFQTEKQVEAVAALKVEDNSQDVKVMMN